MTLRDLFSPCLDMPPAAAGVVGLLVVLATGTVQAQPAGAMDRPRYEIMRQDDDWGFLRDPARRTDYADALKYVPLGASTYGYLGGEARSLYEYRDVALFRSPAANDDGYLLQRFMAHGGVVTAAVPGLVQARAFVELKSGLVAGLRPDPGPPDEDRLDVNQAFVEGTVALGPAPAGPASAGGRPGAAPSLLVRLGRQELSYGVGRLVSVREGPNVRTGFDGALARVRAAGATLDAFYMVPNTTEPGVFDNGRTDGEQFWGLYATGPVPGLAPHTLDVYYFGQDLDAPLPYAQGPSTEVRHTVGARWAVRTPAFSIDAEAAGQFGRVQRRDSVGAAGPSGRIAAWTASTFATVALGGLPLAPELGLYTGVVSGDRDPGDADLGTFRAPYPPGRYFGIGNDLGPVNLAGFRPSLALAPAPGVSVEVGTYVFWRASTRDGLYNPPGFPLRPGGPSRARYVGAIPEAALAWQLDRHFGVEVDVSYFVTGPYLDESGPGADALFVSGRATYRF